MRRRGLSLLETIIASFVLLGAMLASVTLFHVSMQHSVTVQQQSLGVCLAQKRIDQIRAWAQAPGNFDSDWSTWQGVDFTDPDYPGYVARSEVLVPGTVALYSPCSTLELVYPSALRRVLPTALATVRVRVTWGHAANDAVILTRIGRPANPQLAAVVVARTGGAPDPIPQGSTAAFRAEAQDSLGRPIPDVLFKWSTQSLGGSASITSTGTRDGPNGEAVNGYAARGASIYRSGTSSVRAWTRLRGRERSGGSNVVTAP